MRKLFLSLWLSGLFLRLFSGEGMWIPLLLDSLNYKDMQEKGLRLSAEEIYSINNASLKDAIVIFGNGCTGELISPEGLIITNHHCGYSRIQAHSTVEKNYLADGFWAGSKQEELPNPGLTVSFLVRMEDVTEKILDSIPDDFPEQERNRKVTERMNVIKNEAVRNTNYMAEVKSFYFGKEYYLFVYEVFSDVRLVGTPPEAVGNFGGDTDNWIWPRHTGDFSLFRIYADQNNKPAEFDTGNVPYKPRKYLNISLDGVKEGDFTMILGYPGRTDQYLVSDALQLIAEKTLPARVEMRTVRLNAMDEIMARGPEYRLRYASKHKNIANAWKKWIGVTKGVERAGVIDDKKQLENNFRLWSADKPEYAGLIDQFQILFRAYEPLFILNELGSEFVGSLELTSLADRTQLRLFSMGDSSDAGKKQVIRELKKAGSRFFKSNGVEIDRKVLPRILKIYSDYSDNTVKPQFYEKISTVYHNNYDAYVADLFSNSIFTDSVRYLHILEKPEKVIFKAVINDPLIEIYRDFTRLIISNGTAQKLDSLDSELRRFYRNYLTGLMAMDTSRTFYPDANFSMRLTYGKVEGYRPSDGVNYRYISTLDGVIEKEDPEIEDYRVPPSLKELYASGDYGTYMENGKVPVCFIASNHTSGGNSGSPVIDGSGNLIGINFDRNWEGTVSDYAYDPGVCRNISLDIRYVLFIIDKLADADWLLNELTLIDN